ncbi:MAG: HTH domain-containing protein [Acidimicrobiia bacterium]|nr:HTH domain-containing protein [Acidimicrobiia bacterium]MDH5420705.1 HTH domain-containing protein [Acidimicrobiia bacterium]MDH5503934.1 HTH domain-containing protein [Acidimicrobiia bacterium]
MRAARVLEMLLILQRRGRATAGELAALLEVSERTILRDVEALGEAGVPIYTTQGPRGGIELLDGFSTRLTGLTAEEARSLLLVGQPAVSHRLGLGAPARATRNKLLGALAPSLAEQAENLPAWFHHDPDAWDGHRIPHGELRRLGSCIHRSRMVELFFADGTRVIRHPLGLVLKAGSWFLVSVERGELEVSCLDDLRGTRITSQAFRSPEDFDLATFWRSHLGATA